MPIALTDYAYLTLEETKDWIKIPQLNTEYDEIVKRLINTACARVERFIDGPVMSREFVEYSDGNNSTVLMLTHFPVTEITEIIIDYNRAFDVANALEPGQYVLRGLPPLNQAGLTDPEIQVNGSDVVLRDDANVAVLGRLFSGSVVQSIKCTYTAGRGAAADLPDDLKTATLMLIDYLYIVRENRELGVGSKGVMGQSYTRKQLGESGMPEEIEAMLEPYKDYALPPVSMPQRNNMKI